MNWKYGYIGVDMNARALKRWKRKTDKVIRYLRSIQIEFFEYYEGEGQLRSTEITLDQAIEISENIMRIFGNTKPHTSENPPKRRKKMDKIHRAGHFFEYVFYCPGCKNAHGFRTASHPEPEGLTDKEKELFKNKWSWNGDFNKPTIRPSIHVQNEIGKDQNGNPIKETLCHFFVEDGKIRYLTDSRHELSGQTVDLRIF